MKKFSHWVFDLDGTVIDSSYYYEISIKKILLDLGIQATSQDMELAYRYFNPAEYFATFFNDTQKVQRAVDHLIELNHVYANDIPVFAGIEKLFILLQSKGIRLSAWTGRELQSAKVILESTQMMKYFSTCVGRTCVQNNKPHPDGLLKILTDSKYHSDDVVMIGDHEYDMRGAQAAKVKGISVSWDGKAHASARTLSDKHFEQVDDLYQWAESIYGPPDRASLNEVKDFSK